MIDENGDKRGVLPFDEALRIAEQAHQDLVEVSPQANPPVCKIMDYGRMQYEKDRQMRKNKAQSKRAGEMKAVRLTVHISDNDLLTRVKSGQKFLDKGYKVKIELQLRGRQKAHPELAKELIQRYIDLLERPVHLEQDIKRQGGKFSATVANKKK